MIQYLALRVYHNDIRFGITSMHNDTISVTASIHNNKISGITSMHNDTISVTVSMNNDTISGIASMHNDTISGRPTLQCHDQKS